MNLLAFIKKHYLKITIVLIFIGLFIDLFFTDAIPQKTSQTITDLTGKSVSFDAYYFSYKYEILKIISNLCYSLAISILVLLAVELKYDELEKEKFRVLEENERKDFKNEIKELQEQISNNVFEGVLKRLIPEELFNLIAKDILNKNIIRQNAHWIYEVSENEQHGYTVTQTISYELKNINLSSIKKVLFDLYQIHQIL
jgi:hypothetical protein